MPKEPCSELAKTITELALNIGAKPEIKDLDGVVAELQKDIPEITRESVVASINEATTGYAEAKKELTKKLDALKHEARRDQELRKAITDLENDLKAGRVPAREPRTGAEPSAAIESLTEKRDALAKALRKSEPALRAKYETQIQNLNDRLDNGVFTKPEAGPKPELAADLQRLEYQRDLLRKQVRREIDALKPKTLWGRIHEPLDAARAMKTSMDWSAVLRQGGWQLLTHPIRTARAFPEMFKAGLSDEAAYAAAKALEARENAPLYAKHKLWLSDVGAGGLSKQEEVFVSRLAGKVPGVRGSERAYVTFLNRVRADAFDAAVDTLGRDRMLTGKELDALANYVNVTTGRARLPGSLEKAADAMNVIFFAPRWVASRFQILAGQPLYHGSAATRRYVATEYARYLAGVGVVLGLGLAAGGKIETDPRSSDFAKIRFGNTRLDPLSGLGQLTTLISRVTTGKTKTAKGTIESLRNPKFGQPDTGDVIGRFLRGKLSPTVGTAYDLATGKDIAGSPVTPVSAAAGLFTPISFSEIYDIMREQGLPKGAALSLLSLFGMSASTYEPRQQSHTTRDIREAWEWIKKQGAGAFSD